MISANVDNVFRRLVAAMGRPELADDPRFATHAARAANQEEIESIISDWAGERDAAEIDRVLGDAGVPAGVVATIADIFDDPQFRARDMLLDADGRRDRPVQDARRSCPSCRPRPGGSAGPGAGEPGRRQRATSIPGCWARRPTSSTSCGARGRMTTVRICDVAPRDGLQNEPTSCSRPRLARSSAARLLRAGLPVVEAVSFVRRRPRAADGRRRAGAGGARSRRRERCAALVLNERGLDRGARAGRAGAPPRRDGDRALQPAQRERRVEDSLAGVVRA